VEVRPATTADLLQVEQLCMASFASTLWRGVPPEVQLQVRMDLWRTGSLLDGLLVGVDGDQVIGSVAVDTAEAAFRLTRRRLSVLRALGPPRMARFVLIWALTHYRPAVDEAYLHTLVVAPAHRRRSAARRLMAAAEALARQRGKRRTSVLVERANTPSLRLMEGLGYRCTAPRRSAVQALLPGADAVRAEKLL
jgi:ribosomal protein S18 acetylase RimI-like enzyme